MSIYKSDLNLAVELGKIVNNISILENGNVGIGTTNPSNKLDVRGIVYIEGNEQNTGVLHVHDNNSYGEPIARFTANGDGFILIENTKSGTDYDECGVVIKGSSAGGYWLVGTDDSSSLEIKYNASDFHFTGGSGLSVATNGNVGIGTDNPLTKLQIDKPVSSSLDNIQNYHLLLGGINHGNNTYRTIGYGYTLNSTDHPPAYTGFKTSSNSSYTKGHLVFGTRNSTSGSVAPSERMRITDTGNVGIGTTNPAEKLEVNGWIGRSAHNNGGLCGSYNNVGENSQKTNPIYVIGSDYKPNENDLNDMYGIGYSNTNTSFISSVAGSGWGMYVAADGDARIFLNGSTGSTTITGYYYGNGSQLTSLNANNITNLSADKMGYGPNQNCKLHIGPAHWAGANQDVENYIQYEHEITFPGYRDNNYGGYRLASKITGFGISQPYYWSLYPNGVNYRAFYAGGLSFYTCDNGWSGGDQTNKVLTLYKSNAYLKGSLYQNSDNMGTSDLRIKRDIIDINKNEILDKFLKINVKKYKYKDKKRKNKEVYGFIAQEIKEIIDDKGVSLDHNFIYDINEYGTIESNIITCECNLELNTQYRVIINDIKERDIIIKDNLENNKYKIDGYIHNYEEYNSDKIFIQGREVNDFHYLNKNAIFTMNVNVTQELYKMIIDQNKLIKEKEEEIKKHNEILNNLIYRIELLENK
jgi:hypothetical protein